VTNRLIMGRPVVVRTSRRVACAVAIGLASLTSVSVASAHLAPAQRARSEPRLTVSHHALAASVHCTKSVRAATRDPILLVPGTTLDPQSGFSWNYERAYTARHWPWCTVRLPGEAMGDAQIAAQHVVYALRHIHRISHRKVDILGYSQGGMLPRWALKYWPDTRRDVNDYVGIDPSNHGTLDADGICAASCAPAIWQQRDDSAFLAALNSGPETWRGISYTVIYSHADEVVVPNTSPAGSSALHTGRGRITDIAVQHVCPADVSDHLAMGTYDPVAYALAADAFTHRGPASARRIPASVCSQTFQPGIDPSAFAANYAKFAAHVASVLATYPHTSAEPALAPYTR
jgi:hypothetical protein